MQTTQYEARDDLFAPRWLSPLQRPAGDSLPNPLVGSRVVEVYPVFFHHAMQMSIAQDQYVVQAFPPYATQKSLTDRIRLGRSVRRPEQLDACPYSYPGEVSAILAVIVPDQIPWSIPKRCRFP